MNKFFSKIISIFLFSFFAFTTQVVEARGKNTNPDTMTQEELEAYLLESNWETFECPRGTKMFGELCLVQVPGRKNTYVDPNDKSRWYYDKDGCVTPRSRGVKVAGALLQLGFALAAGRSDNPAVQYAAGPAMQLADLGAEVVEEKMVNGCTLTLLRTSVRNKQVAAKAVSSESAQEAAPAVEGSRNSSAMDQILGPAEVESGEDASASTDTERGVVRGTMQWCEAEVSKRGLDLTGLKNKCIAHGTTWGPYEDSENYHCGCRKVDV